MNDAFTILQRRLGAATAVVLAAALGSFCLALLAALLGLPHAVASLRSIAAALAFVFSGLLMLFLLTSLVGAIVRWIDRRNRAPAGQ
jgi:hypothetical protein